MDLSNKRPFQDKKVSFLLAGLFVILFGGIGAYTVLSGHASSPACTTTVSTAADAQNAVNAPSSAGTTVCLAAGSYQTLTFSGYHNSNVIVEPDPAQDPNGAGKVTISGLTIDAKSSHIVVRNFYVYSLVSTPAVTISANGTATQSADSITIDHNDIDPMGIGIGGGGYDCHAPHAPGQPCNSTRKMMTNIILSGNRIHYSRPDPACSTIEQDALKITNFNGVTVTSNEITGVFEPTPPGTTCGSNAAHNDCWQTTLGGLNLMYDHNYVHDNVCQDFFIKDGDVINATIYDNLFLRDRAKPSTLSPGSINVVDIHNLVIRNNTDWSGANDSIFYTDAPPTTCTGDPRCSPTPYDSTADHNVLGTLGDFCPTYGNPAGSHLSENNNILGLVGPNGQLAPGSSCKKIDSTDQVNANPTFMNPATDDYRLASNPKAIGVDWVPGQYTFGPINTAIPPPPPPVNATVQGVVTNTAGQPLSGVYVHTGAHATSTGTAASTYTNTAGHYSLSGIDARHKHNLSFSANGYKTQAYFLLLPAGTNTKNITLAPKGS